MDTELLDFLLRAKRATYAADMAPDASSRPHSKDLHYQEGPLIYIDSYLGEVNFIGEEAVWLNEKAIWGMNYYGRMLIDHVPDGFSACLKGALSNVLPEAPYRGPREFTLGEFTYRCVWEGAPQSYRGIETIAQQDTKIYQLFFHGGSIAYF